MGCPPWRSWGLVRWWYSGTKGSDGIAAAAPEAVSMGRLKVVCAEKVGRPSAEMSGGEWE